MIDSFAEIYDTHPEVSLDFKYVKEAVKNGTTTPFLLIDLDLVRIKARRFKAAMPRVHPHYAFKANPHPEIAKVLIEEGVGFEVASIAELDALLELKVPAHEIYYSNPIKSRQYLEYSAAKGVQWYVLDSVDELKKIYSVKPDASLYLRVDTQNLGSDWPLSGKFGATLTECKEIIQEAVDLRADLAGVTFHVGSQCRNVENWHVGIDNAKMVFDLMIEAGLEPRLLNIGGGYPVRHVKPIPSIEKIGESVNDAIVDLPSSIRIMAEPGRYMVSDSAYLISRVVGTAIRAGTKWVYLDSGVFQGLMETHEGFQYEVYTDHDGQDEIPCTVAGPTCDSMDIMMRDEMLPADLKEGDYVYIPNAGAYTTAYASNFNGFPLPQVYILKK
ncbi:MAG TPA: type III PLP-dependent enzyme [Burkholderiales bacterium]|nr:type III PLP-dependent enzyme [Burkholderiales bacterium]